MTPTKQKVCPICDGVGSYEIPVSSPSWFTSPGETASVPCECKLRGEWKPKITPTQKGEGR